MCLALAFSRTQEPCSGYYSCSAASGSSELESTSLQEQQKPKIPLLFNFQKDIDVVIRKLIKKKLKGTA